MTDHDHTEPGLFAGCPRCIADARHAEEEARWAEAPPITGEAFVLALPDSVDMSSTDFAVETSDFSLPTIDRRSTMIDETHTHTEAQLLELFPNERTNP